MPRRLLLIGPIALAACAELQSLVPDGACGNRILEPEVGEECDTFATEGEGTACGGAASIHACRYVCAPVEDAICPPHWVCGGDGVCRSASGTFDPQPSRLVLAREPERIFFADIDGDHRADLVTQLLQTVLIHYGSEDGAFEDELAIDVGTARLAALADVELDGRTDLLLAGTGGVQILLGRERGVVQPVLSPLAELPGPFTSSYETYQYLRAGDGLSDLLKLEARTIEEGGPLLTFPLQSGSVAIELATLVGRPASELGDFVRPERPAIANLDGRGGEELAITFANTSTIYIISANCRGTRLCDPELRATISTPLPFGGFFGDTVPCHVHFADADGDGTIDILANVGTSEVRTVVAFNDGRGNFCSMPPAEAGCEAAGGVRNAAYYHPLFNPLERTLNGICRTADFDGDGRSDFISGRGEVVVRGAAGLVVRDSLPRGASIGDFNGDGIADAVSPETLGFRVSIGSPRGFIGEYRIRSEIKDLHIARGVVADFDGDSFDDLIFTAESGDLWLLYGGPRGPREDAVLVGRLGDTIHQLFVGSFLSAGGLRSSPDSVPDVALFTAQLFDERAKITLLAGSTQRLFFSTPAVDFSTGQAIDPGEVHAGRFGPHADELPDLLIIGRGDGALGGWLAEGTGEGRMTPWVSGARLESPACEVIHASEPGCGGRFTTIGDFGREEVAGALAAGCTDAAVDQRTFVLRYDDRLATIECAPLAAEVDFDGEFVEGDIDGDGTVDLLVTGLTEQTGVLVFRGGGRPFSSPPITVVPDEIGFSEGNYALLDIDTDPALELAYGYRGSEARHPPRFAFFNFTGDRLERAGTFSIPPSAGGGSFVRPASPREPRDVGGDGFDDLITYDGGPSSTGPSVRVFSQLPVHQ